MKKLYVIVAMMDIRLWMETASKIKYWREDQVQHSQAMFHQQLMMIIVWKDKNKQGFVHIVPSVTISARINIVHKLVTYAKHGIFQQEHAQVVMTVFNYKMEHVSFQTKTVKSVHNCMGVFNAQTDII